MPKILNTIRVYTVAIMHTPVMSLATAHKAEFVQPK